MAEQDMVAAVQAALDHHGIDDRIVVVGQLHPRGFSGASTVGAVAGSELGGVFGDAGSMLGFGLGGAASGSGAAASQHMARTMLVGASATAVYGWRMLNFGRTREPHELVFSVRRADLEVKVHGRVQVRILELIDRSSGAKLELEGPRLPVTHSHELISYLAGEETSVEGDA